MAVLKSACTLILSGKVVEPGETFECPDAMADSLLKRGFAEKLKEAQIIDQDQLDTPPGDNLPPGDQVPEVDPREAEIRADYAKMDKDELIESAKSIGIEVKSSWSKDKIINALVKAELEVSEEE